jgi:opacity protein-like surface antigen
MRVSCRSPLLRLALALAALGGGVAALPGEAHAYERQWHSGASFGYALTTDDAALSGFAAGLHLAYGVNDSWNLMTEGSFAHFGDVQVFQASAGAAYVLDVLEWVPYVGLLGGGELIHLRSDGCLSDCDAMRLGITVPAGLDYIVNRSLAVGVTTRYHLLLGDGATGYLTVGARAEYLWGY